MNAALHPHPAPMTTEAFLAWPGDGSGRRFNLVDGVPRPMSPASPEHAIIQANLVRLVLTAIEAAGLDLVAGVEGPILPSADPKRNVRVPDLVVAGQPVARGQPVFSDPVLLVEVLSPGNQRQTRDNIQHYASLPSVQEIVLVHSQRILIEVQRRETGGAWATETLDGTGSELLLSTVALRCPVSALYRRTWLLQP